MEPAVSAAVITVIFATFSGLGGLTYNSIVTRLNAVEEENDIDYERHQSLRDRVDTIWNFLFGVEDNEEDAGLAGDIQEGFNNIEAELQQTQAKQEEYHTREMDILETLVNNIHDEENIDIEREDILDD